VASAQRLNVVDELMGALELVTQAGQQHVMNKILSILRREILSMASPVAAVDLASLLDAMAELEHEAGRIAPTADAFNRHARVVTGVLGKPNTSVFSMLSTETSVWPTSASGSIYEATMDTKPRLTKQGLRDLNHYGPKATPDATAAPGLDGGNGAKDAPPIAEKKQDAPVSVEA
jgi:hypothetical protein